MRVGYSLPAGLVASLLLAGVPQASAEDEDAIFDLSLEQLMDVPVQGVSLYEGRRVEIPASVTTIGRDEIQSLRAATLLDLLNVLVPGLDALPYQTESGALAPQLSSRGIRSGNSQQVLILVNGFVKLNDLAQGAPSFPLELDPRLLERVEVSRSPGVTYGGAAITVVNLVTRDQFIEGAEVAAEGAVHQHREPGVAPSRFRAGGVAGQRIADWHFGASIAVTKDDGQRYTEIDDLASSVTTDATDLSLAATFSARHRSERVVIRGLVLQEQASAWFAGLAANRANGTTGDRRFTSALDATIRILPTLDLRMGATLGRHRVARDQGERTIASRIDEARLRTQLRFVHDVELFGTHALDVGVGYELHSLLDHFFESWEQDALTRIDAGTFTEHGSVHQHVTGAWIADTWTVTADLVVSLALRADWYHGWGERDEVAFSPRASVGYLVIDGVDLKLLYASSVRPPSLYERLGIHAFPVVGDGDVTREAVHSLEASVGYERGTSSARVTPFVEWHNSRLDFVRSPDTTVFVASNVGTTRAVGVEMELSHRFVNGSRAFANAAFVESVDVATGAPTPDWPRLSAGLGLVLRLGRFDITNTAYLRALRAPPTGLADLAGDAPIHFRWDASAGFQITDSVEVHAQLRNVTDQDNVVLSVRRGLALPQRGRSFMLGFAVDLGGVQ